MRKFLASTRYLIIIAVLALLLASLAAFGWGVSEAVAAVWLVITSLGREPGIIIALIEVVDAFLVATTLLIFALGLYELSVGELKLPKWMIVHNLHDLKSKLGSMLVMVMAVKFLEKLAAWQDALQSLFFALAIASISAVLIAFSRLSDKD